MSEPDAVDPREGLPVPILSMHPDDAALHALLDGGLTARRQAAIDEHRRRCGECSDRLDVLRRDDVALAQLLTRLDVAPPPCSVRDVAARAGQRARGRSRRFAAAAAVVAAMVVAAGAAAAMPGLPLHALMTRLLGASAGATATLMRPASTRAPAAARDSTGTGLAFVPRQGVRVVFQTVQPGGAIRIALTDGLSVRVRHHGGTASYTLDGGAVLVANTGSVASYDIDLPVTLPDAEVRVGRRIVFTKHGSHVTSATMPQGPDGPYVISFLNHTRR